MIGVDGCCAGVGRNSVRRGNYQCGGSIGWCCGNSDYVRNAEDLANVYIGTLVVNLRVVRVEKGGINSSLGLDAIAGISITDGVGRSAVFSRHSKTDGLAWLEVSTGRVDDPLINSGKLIG